jgi:ATP phosphoribosyltransferase regulatory subunit
LRAIDALLTPEERGHVVYDLGEIRGLGYYTGMQFEVFVAGVGRAVGFGGRYDGLLALYGSDRPAVGFALETDDLAELLAEDA